MLSTDFTFQGYRHCSMLCVLINYTVCVYFVLIVSFYFAFRNNLDIYIVLESLSRVKRFSMTLMFMSAKEKQCLQQIFKHLRTASLQSEADIASLAKTYQL